MMEILASDADFNRLLGARIRRLRTERGFTLDALSRASGTSRSMISVIERGESSPTAAVLEKLATALGISLARLFAEPSADPVPLSRRDDQMEWRDPATGYLRRAVSPADPTLPFHIVEIEFPPGARITYRNSRSGHATEQQVWLLSGQLEVTVGDRRHRLGEGDCLACRLDQPTAFHNPSNKPARYAVIVADRGARSFSP